MTKAKLRNRFAFLSMLLVVAHAALAQEPKIVTIDPQIRYQTITGWGGHVYPQAFRHFSDEKFMREMLEELQTTHMRVRSYWYQLEGENDNADPNAIDWHAIAAGDTGLVHDELLMQQELARRGVKLMFAAWRFPYWMAGMPADWQPKSDQKPYLPAGMDAEFVESMVAYLLYARDRYNFVFDAVSVANEPDIGIYIMGLDSSRLLRISQQLGKRLDVAGYATRFYPPEVAAADSIGRAYADAFFKLEGAAQHTASVSYHTYRRERSVIEFFRELGERHHLPVWATEQNDTHLGVSDRHEWSHGLKNAICLHDILVYGNVSLSVYFSFAMANSQGLSLYLPEKRDWAPAYDMLKHFYNFAPPGSVRIDSKPDASGDGLRTLAFAQPGNRQIAAILINSAQEERRIALRLNGQRKSIHAAFISDANARFDAFAVAEISNDMPTFALPPESVATVVLGGE